MSDGAIFGYDLVPIQREIGHSVTAARAYQAALCITDGRTGRVYDFRKKQGVVRSAIAWPDTADAAYWSAQPESQIWTAVEQAEIRKDAVTGRTVVVPLPSSPTVSDEYCCDLLANQAAWMSRVLGVPVGWSFHRAHRRRAVKDPISGLILPGGDPRNRHGHFIIGARRIIGREFASKRELPDGTRGLDDRKVGSTIIHQMRQHWEQLNNTLFAQLGLSIRIDSRSRAARGDELPPQIKVKRADLERARRALESGETDELPATVLAWLELEEAKQACRRAQDEARQAELAEGLGDSELADGLVDQQACAGLLSSGGDTASGMEQDAAPEPLAARTNRPQVLAPRGEHADARHPTSGPEVGNDPSSGYQTPCWAMGAARRGFQQDSINTAPSAFSYTSLTYAAKTKWGILNKHYGKELDRSIGLLLHFVRRPEKHGHPLTLGLITRETLEDYGDEIIVYSDCGFSDASVTTFVAMVQAAGWPAVELAGTELWIERVSAALQAAGIPWSLEGQDTIEALESGSGNVERFAQAASTKEGLNPERDTTQYSTPLREGWLISVDSPGAVTVETERGPAGEHSAATLARRGLPVTNPELFVVFQDHRRRLASGADPEHTPTAPSVSSAGDGEPSAAGSVPVVEVPKAALPVLPVLPADARAGAEKGPPAVASPDVDTRHAPLASVVMPRTPEKGGSDGVGAANTPARGGSAGTCPALPRRFSVQDWDRLHPGAPGLLDDWRIDPRVLERYRDSLRHDDGYSCIAHRAVNGTVVGFTVVPPVPAAVHVPGTEHGLVMFGDRRSCSRVAVTSTALDALALAQYEESFEHGRTLYLGLHPNASDTAYEVLGSVLRQCRAPQVVLAFTADQVGYTHEAAVLPRLAQARNASGDALRLGRLKLPLDCTSWIRLAPSGPSYEAVFIEPIDLQGARNHAPGLRARGSHGRERDD